MLPGIERAVGQPPCSCGSARIMPVTRGRIFARMVWRRALIGLVAANLKRWTRLTPRSESNRFGMNAKHASKRGVADVFTCPAENLLPAGPVDLGQIGEYDKRPGRNQTPYSLAEPKRPLGATAHFVRLSTSLLRDHGPSIFLYTMHSWVRFLRGHKSKGFLTGSGLLPGFLSIDGKF